MPFSTDNSWPAGLLNIFEICRKVNSPLENRYYGPYDKLINYCFGDDPFVSCPLLIICTTLNKKSYSQITAAKQFSPSFTFANTHSNGDPECDDLATDVSGYKSTDLPSNPGKADFAKMDLFAEFKFDANADPLH